MRLPYTARSRESITSEVIEVPMYLCYHTYKQAMSGLFFGVPSCTFSNKACGGEENLFKGISLFFLLCEV